MIGINEGGWDMFAVQTEKHISGERFSCVVEGVEVLLNIPLSKCSPF
jgi:hypothetical protein